MLFCSFLVAEGISGFPSTGFSKQTQPFPCLSSLQNSHPVGFPSGRPCWQDAVGEEPTWRVGVSLTHACAVTEYVTP